MNILTQVVLPLMLLASPFFIVFVLINKFNPGNIFYKLAVAWALLTGFLLFWVNLAGGIMGSEDNDANVMFVVVIMIGLIASTWVKFQTLEMSYVMLTLAVSHVFIVAIELIFQFGVEGPIWPFDVIGASCIFVVLWFCSALLFRKAAQVQYSKQLSHVQNQKNLSL